MGFIKWIKKELKSTSHKRRESAPTYISNEFDPNLARDEAYLKALTTFNEWRTNQRLERLSRDPQEKTPAEVLDDMKQNKKRNPAVANDVIEDCGDFKNFEEFKINQTLYENTINLETKSPRKENRRTRRYSPPYQAVVNKHGDVVEYALPYNEQLNPGPAEEDDVLPLHINNNSYVEIPKTDNVIVTDLDKSIDSRQFLKTSNPVVPSEHNRNVKLNALASAWCNKSSSPHHQTKTNGILVAEPNENWFQTNIFHSTCLPLLEFSKGIFRNTEVGFRTNKIINKDSVFVSKYALQRDMDILNSIRQSNIIMLMAISYDDYDEFKRMSLILEPFDCSINHFLYEMNQQFSILQIIKIMQQISSAVIYLHECGYIHSNISTNSVLITKYQSFYIAKLSNFELTTELNYQNIQNDIKSLYQTGNTKNYYRNDDRLEKMSEYIILLKNVQRNLKDQYYGLSRNKNLPVTNLTEQADNFSRFNGKIGKKYYPYYVEYRKLFSLYYYQSPELMNSNFEFVYPTKSTDIYQMTLLLWEILNSCIPFVIFDELEMEKLYSSNLQCSILNNFTENCKYFDKILKYGLQVQLRKRIMTMKHLKLLLDNVEIELIKQGVLEEEKLLVTPVKAESNHHLDFNGKCENTSHFASFNRFLATKANTYDRTSTLKKKVKQMEEPPRKSARELFNKLDDELNLISDEIKYNKSEIIKEFDCSAQDKEELRDILENIETDFSTPPPKSQCRNNASHSFSLLDMSLPDTPIARKNKLRKQAWLNGYRNGGKQCSVSPISPDIKGGAPCSLKNNSRVEINKLEEQYEEIKKPENLTNLADDISKCINDKFKDLLPDFTNKILNELKVAQSEKHEKKSIVQMEVKPILEEKSNVNDKTFNMTDILTEAMKRHERRVLSNEKFCEAIESKKGASNFSDSDSDASDSVSKRVSVHEAVAKIESRAKKSMIENSQPKYHMATSASKFSPSKPLIEFTPPSTPVNAPPIRTAPVTPVTPRNTAVCKKITTRVTLNFRKSLHQVSSPLQSPLVTPHATEINMANFQQPVTLQRHSISSQEIIQLMDRQKVNRNMNDLLFCNGCQSQIKHSNILGMFSSQNNLPQLDSCRLSDASNILRLEKKSTEDLYIDDDFCQGINLGANMELITIDSTDEDEFLNLFNFDMFASNEKQQLSDTDKPDSKNDIDNETNS